MVKDMQDVFGQAGRRLHMGILSFILWLIMSDKNRSWKFSCFLIIRQLWNRHDSTTIYGKLEIIRKRCRKMHKNMIEYRKNLFTICKIYVKILSRTSTKKKLPDPKVGLQKYKR